MKNDKNELFLIYVNNIGKNSENLYEYEFFFSAMPEIAWGIGWREEYPSFCDQEEMIPEKSTYTLVAHLTTDILFDTAQNNKCYKFEYCIKNIISCAYEDISELTDYPSPYRIVFRFGESYQSVENKLGGRSQMFTDIISYGDNGERGNGDEEDDNDINSIF